jgi:hypothetical protein
MRRYTITVNDTAKVVDVEALGADTFRVQLDGRLVDVRLEDHRDLAWDSPITPAIQARRTAATHGTAPAWPTPRPSRARPPRRLRPHLPRHPLGPLPPRPPGVADATSSPPPCPG